MKNLFILLTIFISFASAFANADVIDTYDRGADSISGGSLVGDVLDDDIKSGWGIFWPHDNQMNRLTTFSWDEGVVNGEGDDLAFFLNSVTGSHGRIVSVSINGVSMNIGAEIEIENYGVWGDEYAGLWTGTVDLSDFGIADDEIVYDVSFNAAVGPCGDVALWGSCSDTFIAGASAEDIEADGPVEVPEPSALVFFALFCLGLFRIKSTLLNRSK